MPSSFSPHHTRALTGRWGAGARVRAAYDFPKWSRSKPFYEIPILAPRSVGHGEVTVESWPRNMGTEAGSELPAPASLRFS